MVSPTPQEASFQSMRARIAELNDRLAEVEKDRDEQTRLGNDALLAMAARAETAERERDEARRCLGFFASVIKSGEPWTATCQREYDNALSPSASAVLGGDQTGAPPAGSGSRPSDEALRSSPPDGGVDPSRWQPIETAPKDGKWFLAFGYYGCEILRFDHYAYKWMGANGWEADQIKTSHSEWMPLPMPPSVSDRSAKRRDRNGLDRRREHDPRQRGTPDPTGGDHD